MLRSFIAATLALSLFPTLAMAATSTLVAVPSINPLVSTFSGQTLSDSCVAPEAGSFANDMLSFGINIGRVDEGCEIRKEAKLLFDFGYPAAGMRVICTVPRVEKAMTLAGTPCEAITSDELAHKPLVLSPSPVGLELQPRVLRVPVAPMAPALR